MYTQSEPSVNLALARASVTASFHCEHGLPGAAATSLGASDGCDGGSVAGTTDEIPRQPAEVADMGFHELAALHLVRTWC